VERNGFEKAAGVICPGCGREVFRVVGQLCPRCAENVLEGLTQYLRRANLFVEIDPPRSAIHINMFTYKLDIYYSPAQNLIYYKPQRMAERFAFRRLEDEIRRWAEVRGLAFFSEKPTQQASSSQP